MADEPARSTILRALDGEDPVLAHPRRHLLVLGRAPYRQGPEHRAFDGQAPGGTPVQTLHDLINEGFVASALIEAA